MQSPDRLDTLMTAADAATATGIPAGTIRTWASRKQLTAEGLNERGHRMYRLGKILLCERDRRVSALGGRG